MKWSQSFTDRTSLRRPISSRVTAHGAKRTFAKYQRRLSANMRHPDCWVICDQRRLGVGAQLRWARAKCRQRRLGERSPELKQIFDQRFKVGAGRLAGERVLENRGNRDASQRGAGGRAVLAIDLLDESDGLADGHDVLALLRSISAQQILSVQVSWTKGRCHRCPSRVNIGSRAASSGAQKRPDPGLLRRPLG